MRVERTFDYALVRRIITHPKLFPFCTEDGGPSLENFEPAEGNHIYYLIPFLDVPIGVIIFVHQNAIMLSVHICILPKWWGRAKEASIAALKWVFANTDYRKIIGSIPEYNRHARRLGLSIGFIEEGRQIMAFLKNGREWDLILMGIRKEAICLQS